MTLPAPPHHLESAHHGDRLSEVVRRLGRDLQGDDITLGELFDLLGDRGFGLLIMILAAPNSIPVPGPPGLSTVFAVPIMLLAGQMILGRQKPALPRFLRAKRFSGPSFRRFIDGAVPWLERAEKLVRPRRTDLFRGRRFERLLGVVVLLAALILALPIPLGNFLPGLTMVVIALSILEEDAVTAVAGIVLGIISVLWIGILFRAGTEILAWVQATFF